MAEQVFIKTREDGVVVEYCEYHDAPDGFMPTAAHVKLNAVPPTRGDVFGRTYSKNSDKTKDGTFSEGKAPGFEPDAD